MLGDSFEQREEVEPFQWFGKILVHAGGETALAVTGHLGRGQLFLRLLARPVRLTTAVRAAWSGVPRKNTRTLEF